MTILYFLWIKLNTHLMMNNLIYLVFFSLLFVQCKVGQNSTAQTTKIPQSRKETTLNPDECVVNAKVLKLISDGVYSLRIYEVKETGFGFHQNINAGDKIEVRIPVPLDVDEIRDITIEWKESVKGGHYIVTTGAE